ncbi:hypothetical protein FY557_17375 [Chryseobacterium sp. SN22]|uniref:hypothetical protein n=1 Tax=Chryseobacterium sp. SN22 TaxID=2606431 RepID=UPI0011ED5B31|nr:hypothetical protein [Chryseobacterium sp. SN22]KAA0126421.1 hypothetical protein FY557_17375 [Chryseobacterium sp. SN22]
MTTQEQLNIYAAYLPYQLHCELKDEVGTYEITHLNICEVQCDGVNTIEIHIVPLTHIKPILYDLSHLTKEIEHEGRVFTPIDVFEITDDHDSYSVEYDHGNIKLIRGLKAISESSSYYDIQFLPFEVVQRLISWHFNVFGIPAGDFIDKATIKTESND